jgi:hypothetical protein
VKADHHYRFATLVPRKITVLDATLSRTNLQKDVPPGPKAGSGRIPHACHRRSDRLMKKN